jgi:DNA repair exonuclease SbcCD ATPase subunit
MKSSSALRTNRAPYLAAAALAAVIAFSGLAPGLALAEDAGSAPGGKITSGSPVDEFSQQLEAFQKSVPDLTQRIQDGAGVIDSATDIDKARAEIDSLRQDVSTLLAAVADNGPISQLGAKALNHIHDKLQALAQDGRFKPEERQYLLDQWQRLQAQTQDATKELQDARAQFAGLLQTLQSNEDFIGELIEIRQAEKALDVIRGLTQDIRNASSQLNKLIGGIKPPGA